MFIFLSFYSLIFVHILQGSRGSLKSLLYQIQTEIVQENLDYDFKKT